MKGPSVTLHIHVLRPDKQNPKKPRYRPVFRVRFDRTNLIFKPKKPVDILYNEATFIRQYQQ